MRNPSDAATRVTRRQFLACCSALAVGGVSCTTLGRDTRSGHTLLSDPTLEEYDPILRALIHTVLPCEQRAFPVTGPQVQARLLQLFELERDPRFRLLQRSFVLFDQTDLFPHFQPLVEEERRWRGSPEARHSDREIGADFTHDRELHASFARAGTPSRFVSLSLDRQREYFDLWRRSRFLLRRAFHSTTRSLVLIAAYSMDDMWSAIGYEGPFVRTRGATRS